MQTMKSTCGLRSAGGIKKLLWSTLLSLLVISISSAQDQDLNVLSTQGKTWLRFSNAHHALNLHLADEADKLLMRREQQVAQLNSLDEVEGRQREVKSILNELIGSTEKDTPLNATITGTVKKDGFTMEFVVYESLPGFYVTGTLFIPDGVDKPAPAILFCSGHSAAAYRRDVYQIPLLNLVKKGFVVFAIDPLGQGERLQYLDPETGESVIGSSTKEHSYPMVQMALLGRSIAEYFALDGIRAIDYLVGRPEVDPSRIGVHGLSGGGTQTAYIAALDDRVKASAPSGYITNYRRIFESIGVQDGEQNLYRGISNGIDHPELLLAMAPKPTLIMATTRDFFSIEGTRETYEEMLRLYKLYGKSENINLVEGDYGHGYTKNIREAMYAFFQEHLENPGTPAEEEVEFVGEEIKITTTGQVSTAVNSKNVFDLNRNRAVTQLEELQKARTDLKAHLSRVPDAAKQLSGYQAPEKVDKPFFMGRLQKEGYSIEKYFIGGEGDYVIPYLLFIPEKKNAEAVLYLHPKGKQNEAGSGGEIEKLVDKGYTVMAPDLLGIGEQEPMDVRGDANIEGVSYNAWFSGMTIGRSILGIRAGDVSRLVQVLKQKENVDGVHGVAKNEMGPVLLHAAAFNHSITSVELIGSYISYESIVLNEFYKTDYVHSIVQGALLAYDLPDLAATLAPRRLRIMNFKDGTGEKMTEDELKSALTDVYQTYRSHGSLHQLTIETNDSDGLALD